MENGVELGIDANTSLPSGARRPGHAARPREGVARPGPVRRWEMYVVLAHVPLGRSPPQQLLVLLALLVQLAAARAPRHGADLVSLSWKRGKVHSLPPLASPAAYQTTALSASSAAPTATRCGRCVSGRQIVLLRANILHFLSRQPLLVRRSRRTGEFFEVNRIDSTERVLALCIVSP